MYSLSLRILRTLLSSGHEFPSIHPSIRAVFGSSSSSSSSSFFFLSLLSSLLEIYTYRSLAFQIYTYIYIYIYIYIYTYVLYVYVYIAYRYVAHFLYSPLGVCTASPATSSERSTKLFHWRHIPSPRPSHPPFIQKGFKRNRSSSLPTLSPLRELAICVPKTAFL